MPPNSTAVADEQNAESIVEEKVKFKTEVIWFNVLLFVLLHATFVYGVYLSITSGLLKTILFSFLVVYTAGLGITAGIHRLWSHRAYKAKWPLRVFLSILASIAAQRDIFEWSRDHRVHHKFSETNADPHNINRGFFFAHMGWLMCKKHPDVVEKGKCIQLDDLLADPVVRFQRRFYFPMAIFFGFYLPTMIPVWFWDETLVNSFFIAGMMKYSIILHISFLVNSAAHYFGNQPYDKYIQSRENPIVSLLAMGEGWHNYHHAFPWDYSTSELGYTLNITKLFIDFMAYLGLAYDLKYAHPEMVMTKKMKTGDGTRIEGRHLKTK